MIRTLVLFLLIGTPLFSQDLLVDSIDREFSGTLIKITDTYIFFQIHGETEPVQYPYWSVQRVTLADGRLAFADGKNLLAKPTLPVEPKAAAPTPTMAKPMEPKPMEAGPEVEKPTLLPAPVPEPAEIEVVAAGTPPIYSGASLRTMARNNAGANFGAPGWDIGGGFLGCGGMFIGSILGVVIGGFSDISFMIGAGVGGFIVVELIARQPNIVVPIPEELASAEAQLQEQYRHLYLTESRKLKRTSILAGMGGCCLLWLGISMAGASGF